MTVLQKEFLDLLDEYGFDVFDIKMLKVTNRFKDPEISPNNGFFNRTILELKSGNLKQLVKCLFFLNFIL